MTKHDLLEFVTNSSGRINSRAVTEDYFVKCGRSDLWNFFQETYCHMAVSDHEKLAWIRAGYDFIPICGCGNKAKLLNGKPSNYCSQSCVMRSSDRISKLKASLLTVDKEKANSKRQMTMQQKYGVSYNSQRSDVKEILQRSKLEDQSVIEKLNSREWMDTEYNVNKRTAVDISRELNVFYGTVLDYCRMHGFSIRTGYNESLQEKIIKEFLDSLHIDYIEHDRTVLGGEELDIFIPVANIAIEVNGLYWHSFPGCKEKHIKKYNACREKGIRLLQFTDLEVNEKFNIVRSMIVSRLGLSTQIYARKCKVSDVPVEDARLFLNTHHLHGFSGASRHLGLYYNGFLVMMMSYGKSRFKHDSFELIRLCTKSDCVVTGGFSRLLHASKLSSIISYCDKMFSDGHGYKMVGFKQVGETSPGYIWTDGNTVISRHKCQRANLKRWLKTFDESKTEVENMQDAGYRQYWNCGNLIFQYG